MANKLVMGFAFQFKGDNTHNTITITLATGPVSFFPYGGSSAAPSLLSGVTTAVPSGVSLLSCAGLTISSNVLALGILTITFSTNPDGVYNVSGLLEF